MYIPSSFTMVDYFNSKAFGKNQIHSVIFLVYTCTYRGKLYIIIMQSLFHLDLPQQQYQKTVN